MVTLSRFRPEGSLVLFRLRSSCQKLLVTDSEPNYVLELHKLHVLGSRIRRLVSSFARGLQNGCHRFWIFHHWNLMIMDPIAALSMTPYTNKGALAFACRTEILAYFSVKQPPCTTPKHASSCSHSSQDEQTIAGVLTPSVEASSPRCAKIKVPNPHLR